MEGENVRAEKNDPMIENLGLNEKEFKETLSNGQLKCEDDDNSKPHDLADARGQGFLPLPAYGSSTGQSRRVIPAHTPWKNLYYKMDSQKRGYCLVFNHKNFHPNLDMETRFGTDKDRDDIVNFFTTELNFTVQVFNDLTLDSLKKQLDYYALKDHSAYDCLVVFFLSHGEDGVFYAQDAAFRHDELFDVFDGTNCPTLAGKPKIFFIQACRGGQMDRGVLMVEQTDSPGSEYKLPVTADYFTMWSTVPGYYSWRRIRVPTPNLDPITKGSWFIQSLLKVLRSHVTQYDLGSLHVLVNQHMIAEYESKTPSKPATDKMKQVSSFVSTGTHLLHFFPISEVSLHNNEPAKPGTTEPNAECHKKKRFGIVSDYFRARWRRLKKFS
ncbi:caspase-1 isoform X2 [Hyalella azteca]|uniref:Caspase-1 isoform X2 n=1 Tax=Hyalella azteca TaxID=294128 RepID=A0A979FX55_HYAAZ|nr:caspase-1 isoform X2 [Hyalella azteca]